MNRNRTPAAMAGTLMLFIISSSCPAETRKLCNADLFQFRGGDYNVCQDLKTGGCNSSCNGAGSFCTTDCPSDHQCVDTSGSGTSNCTGITQASCPDTSVAEYGCTGGCEAPRDQLNNSFKCHGTYAKCQQ